MGDHSFSGEGSRSTVAGGIVSLMQNIAEQLEAEIAKSNRLEQEAKDEYDKMKEESDTEKSDLNDKIDDYRDEKADTEGKIEDNEGLKKDEEDSLAESNKAMHQLLVVGDVENDIPFPCYFMPGEYHNRRHRRDAEVEGLKEGISFLEGM